MIHIDIDNNVIGEIKDYINSNHMRYSIDYNPVPNWIISNIEYYEYELDFTVPYRGMRNYIRVFYYVDSYHKSSGRDPNVYTHGIPIDELPYIKRLVKIAHM